MRASLVLAGEIEEQRAFGDARSGGDLFGPGGGKALLDEKVQRGVQKFARTGFLAALTFGVGVAGNLGNEFGEGHTLLTDWLVM